jgi:hypothetical protein
MTLAAQTMKNEAMNNVSVTLPAGWLLAAPGTTAPATSEDI